MNRKSEEDLDKVIERELSMLMANMDELVDMFEIVSLSERLRKDSGAKRHYDLFRRTRKDFIEVADKQALLHVKHTRRRLKIYIEAMLLGDEQSLARARHILSKGE